MSRLAQVLALAAFAFPLALAGWVVEPEGVECGMDGDCDKLRGLDDETSLVQLQANINTGRHRSKAKDAGDCYDHWKEEMNKIVDHISVSDIKKYDNEPATTEQALRYKCGQGIAQSGFVEDMDGQKKWNRFARLFGHVDGYQKCQDACCEFDGSLAEEKIHEQEDIIHDQRHEIIADHKQDVIHDEIDAQEDHKRDEIIHHQRDEIIRDHKQDDIHDMIDAQEDHKREKIIHDQRDVINEQNEANVVKKCEHITKTKGFKISTRNMIACCSMECGARTMETATLQQSRDPGLAVNPELCLESCMQNLREMLSPPKMQQE